VAHVRSSIPRPAAAGRAPGADQGTADRTGPRLVSRTFQRRRAADHCSRRPRPGPRPARRPRRRRSRPHCRAGGGRVSRVGAQRMPVRAGLRQGFYAEGEVQTADRREVAGRALFRSLRRSVSRTWSILSGPRGGPRAAAARRCLLSRIWPLVTGQARHPRPKKAQQTVYRSKMTPASRHEISVFNRDHEFVTAKGFPSPLFRRRNISRTVTSGHGHRAPTRDQPREACRGR
jgi:hypothetical protein